MSPKLEWHMLMDERHYQSELPMCIELPCHNKHEPLTMLVVYICFIVNDSMMHIFV